MIKKWWGAITDYYEEWKLNKQYKKKIKDLNKKDPYTYK